MKLTAAEKKWIADVQEVLAACPSDRLGFYTIGDPDVVIYDRTKEKKITDIQISHGNMDFGDAVRKANAVLDISVRFPAHVHSVAG